MREGRKPLKDRWARVFGRIALTAAILTPAAGSAADPLATHYILYVGGYTRVAGKGVYAYRFTPATGDVAPLGLVQDAVNPSWLADDPTHRFLYAANEHPAKGAPDTGNSVTAYARNERTGKLTLLNAVPSQGVGPAHLNVDRTGKTLVVANFGSANIATFAINSDGSVGSATGLIEETGKAAGPSVPQDENGLSPTDSHIHCATISPDNRYVLSCNIGLGQISLYRLNAATGALARNGEPFRPASLAGHRWRPRHLAFDPTGKFVYIMDISMHLTTAAYDATRGTLTEIQTIPVITGSPPNQSVSGSEIGVDRSGRFVYTSSRPVDSTFKSVGLDGIINVFAVDPATHRLTPIQHIPTHGDSPRSFAFDPSGAYLFVGNAYSGSIIIFAVDTKTGLLSPTGKLLKDSPEPATFVFEAEP